MLNKKDLLFIKIRTLRIRKDTTKRPLVKSKEKHVFFGDYLFFLFGNSFLFLFLFLFVLVTISFLNQKKDQI